MSGIWSSGRPLSFHFKKDKAYTLLNVFWIMVGIVGIARASGVL
jgi:hypothetical protein